MGTEVHVSFVELRAGAPPWAISTVTQSSSPGILLVAGCAMHASMLDLSGATSVGRKPSVSTPLQYTAAARRGRNHMTKMCARP